MPGLGPGIYVCRAASKTWMAGTSPANDVVPCCHSWDGPSAFMPALVAGSSTRKFPVAYGIFVTAAMADME
jgi:hypothetical protein